MKKWLIILICLGLILGGGYIWGRPAYRQWQQNRLLTQARELLAKGDNRGAALTARRTLEVNPGNVEACRIMAQITESLHSPVALQWRQRIVDLEPNNLSNRLDLARTAILDGDYALAGHTLEQAKTNPPTAAYHQMVAMVEIGQNNIAAAERHFAEAARLDPTNKLIELNRAIIHLQARDEQVVAGALKTLEQFYQDPVYRKDALRHLAMAASRVKDYGKAAAFTKELVAGDKVPLEDRLMNLTVLKDGKREEFAASLAEVQALVVDDPGAINMLAGWMLAHEMPAEAAKWLTDLPSEKQAERPVALAIADAYMARGDWAGLQARLADAKWGDLEFMRLAMMSRAAREQRQDIASEAHWRAAVSAADDNPRTISVLARMANKWGWERKVDDLMWSIIQRFPSERWALQALNQMYTKAGNTRGLYRIYTTLVNYNANDVVAQNNLATVSLLLNLQTTKAAEMARDAHEKYPKNEAFACTYAYSLHLKARTKEGLKILQTLQPRQLEVPGVALYYGVLLAADGEKAEARKYLDRAAEGDLLPEERTLLNSAKQTL